MLKIKESLLKKLIREAIYNYDNDIIYIAVKFVKEFDKREIFQEDGSLNFLHQKFERLDPREEIFSKNEWNIFDSATKALEDHEKQLIDVCIHTRLVCDMTDRVIQDIEILEISVDEYHFPMNGFSMMKEIPGTLDVLNTKQEEAFKIFNEKPLFNVNTPGTKILEPLQRQKINDLFEENIFDLYDVEVMLSAFDSRFEIFRRMEISVKNLNYLDCPFAVGLHRVIDIYEFHEFLKSIGFIAQYNNIRNTIYNKYTLENGNMNLEFEYDWNDPPAPPSIDSKKPNLSIGTAKIESIDIKEDNMKEFSYTARNTIRAIVKIAERYDLGD